MNISIDTTSVNFKIEKPANLWAFRGKKTRDEIDSNYDSENYTLPKYYEKSNINSIPLVGIFDSLSEMENELHKLFYLAIFKPGDKIFEITHENGAGISIPFQGVVKSKTQVKYKRDSERWIIRLTLKITDTYAT